jgi:hypothetical protein
LFLALTGYFAVIEKGREAESRHNHTHNICHHCQPERVAPTIIGAQAGQGCSPTGEWGPAHQATQERPGGRRGATARGQEGQAVRAPATL